MLRLGLTGGLGSGKTTVARLFAQLGARTISADEVGRALMQPGEQVYEQIVARFGPSVLCADGSLDRKRLAELAFKGGRADALNRIVHPAVVAAEESWMDALALREPDAVALLESALIFEVERWGTAPGWLRSFDKLMLVTAPDEVKVARYLERMCGERPCDEERRAALARDAEARLHAQIPDREKAPRCDYVIDNSGRLDRLRETVAALYPELQALARSAARP